MTSSPSGLIDFFDRLYIIHLPERVDRYVHLKKELQDIGIPIDHPKVVFMEGQWSESPNGFASLGAYGNFMSHLRILRQAYADGLHNVWILEDDAIFRRMLRWPELQTDIVNRLEQPDWDLAYIGHKIQPRRLRALKRPHHRWTMKAEMIPFPPEEEFIWAHCYGVSRQGIQRLLPYLEETLVNPPGHPRGGRMFVDGALNMFRRLHPDARTLVSNPNLSYQMGSMSSLAARRAYDGIARLRPLVSGVRAFRDTLWKFHVLR